MEQVTFVTSNPNKLREAQAILPFKISSKKLELTEIQSLDVEEVVRHKLREAYDKISEPVIVEDVSAGLASLNGLPGPFIKFFEQQLGIGALYKLSKVKDDQATIICCMGYYDGKKIIIVKGVLKGAVVAPRGENGWGFDKVIMPEGHDRTMGEMSDEEKNSLSHRYRALMALKEKLEAR